MLSTHRFIEWSQFGCGLVTLVMRLALFFFAFLALSASQLPYYNALYHGPNSNALSGSDSRSFRLPKECSELVAHDHSIHSDAALGVPTFLWASKTAHEKLKADPGQGQNNIESMARTYLHHFAPAYRLDEQDLQKAQLKHIHDIGVGCIIAQFKQVVNTIEVFCLELNVMMNRDLDLVCLSGCLSPDASSVASPSSEFKIGFPDAATFAFHDLTGETIESKWLEIMSEREDVHYLDIKQAHQSSLDHRLNIPIRMKKVYFQLPHHLEPAYYVELKVNSKDEPEINYISYVISAADGKLLFRNNLTSHEKFNYTVFAESGEEFRQFDGPLGKRASPHPLGKNDHFDLPFVGPSSISLQNVSFSRNDPWLTPGSTETKGNNVDAFADLSFPVGFSAGDLRASTNGPNTFDYTYSPLRNPGATLNQKMAAITNVFYITNLLHDWFYDFGFNEASGNAQRRNFGRGGKGNDILIVQGQSVAGRNNASMATPADGASPEMELDIFDDPTVLSPDGYTTVLSPADIAGDYPARIPAFFGPGTFDITREVVLVNDGVDITTDACEAIVNGNSLVDKIVLIDRRVCLFTEKVLKAQNKGAAGVIIANNVGPSLPPLGGANPAITIPTMGIGEDHGHLLKDAIRNGLEVVVRLHDEFIQEDSIDRDSMVDNTVVTHEWGHYLTCRLVGDANGLGNNQGRSLGEGWSDFLSLLFIVQPEDALVPTNQHFGGIYGVPGAYVTGDAYFGFRRYPYSTDLKKNPLLFRHIEDDVALPDPAEGGPPIAFGQSGLFNSEVHNSGEVWCVMLWECYASLLNDERYTFDQAQDRMKEYLVASLKSTPTNPTYTEARDALLAVAEARDHDDFILFSEAFAKRGMGINAESPPRTDSTHSGVIEDFEAVTPEARLEFVEAVLVESDNNGDQDGILDIGETGSLIITLKNSGLMPLSNTTGTVMPTNLIQFSNNGQMQFPNSKSGNEVTGTVQAVLLAPPENVTGALEITITFTDSHPDVAVKSKTISFKTNIDEFPNQTVADDVENGNDGWTIESELGIGGAWRVEPVGISNDGWFGPNVDVESVQSLVSPELEVDSSSAFSMSFIHRYAFDPSETDGGVIELSTDDGLSWTDIGQFAVNGYNGMVDPTNPMGHRQAYVNTSPDYPEFIQEKINLGDQYHGQRIKIRFRLGSNEDTAAIGWHIDAIQFQGITNLPFTETVNQGDFRNFCGNIFYDSNSVAPAAPAGNAGDTNRMFGVLFDPMEFGYDRGFFITQICVSNQLVSGGPWQNKLFIYPDINGVPDDSVVLGEGVMSSGDGTGPDTITFNPPIIHNGRFWVLNRGDPSLSEELLYLEFDQKIGSHSFASQTGINGLERQNNLNYHIRATLLVKDLVLSLQEGWNLISLPIKPDQNVQTMLNSVIRGHVYTWTNGSFLEPRNKIDFLDTTAGYWIYAQDTQPFQITTEILTARSTNGELNPGWNLFGPANIINNPYNANINGAIWYWENNQFHPVFRPGGRLEVGKAYWVNSKIKQTYPNDSTK